MIKMNEINRLRKNVGTLQKKVNCLKKKCDEYRKAVELRLEQIRNSEKLFEKLKQEGKITTQELKEAILSKRQVKEK